MACRSVLTHSPEELQTASDLVVVFTPQSHETVLKRYSDGNVQFGYTKTTGRVEEVLHAPCDGMVFTLREYPIVNSGSLIARVLGGDYR